jgi:hypothetical protein
MSARKAMMQDAVRVAHGVGFAARKGKWNCDLRKLGDPVDKSKLQSH